MSTHKDKKRENLYKSGFKGMNNWEVEVYQLSRLTLNQVVFYQIQTGNKNNISFCHY